MSLRLPLHSLQRLHTFFLRINRKIISPFKCPLVRLIKRFIFILEEGLHLHLFSRFSARFALIFLLLLGLRRVSRRGDGVGRPPSLWATTRED